MVRRTLIARRHKKITKRLYSNSTGRDVIAVPQREDVSILLYSKSDSAKPARLTTIGQGHAG
jgi:hypothetical protein